MLTRPAGGFLLLMGVPIGSHRFSAICSSAPLMRTKTKRRNIEDPIRNGSYSTERGEDEVEGMTATN